MTSNTTNVQETKEWFKTFGMMFVYGVGLVLIIGLGIKLLMEAIA